MADLQLSILHLDLRIKDHITMQKFEEDISPFFELQKYPVSYQKNLIEIGKKYRHLELATLKELVWRVPKKWRVDDETNMYILDQLAQSLDHTYYNSSASRVTNAIADRIAQWKIKKNKKSQKNNA